MTRRFAAASGAVEFPFPIALIEPHDGNVASSTLLTFSSGDTVDVDCVAVRPRIDAGRTYLEPWFGPLQP
jgi:hypothetical protein